jgi:hypothetical protein
MFLYFMMLFSKMESTMTRISKCDALSLTTFIETPEQMLKFARANAIPEVEEQAKTMLRSLIAIRTTFILSPLLYFAVSYGMASDPTREYVFQILAVTNTAVTLYALKQLYNTACYLQTALAEHPRLRRCLFRAL